MQLQFCIHHQAHTLYGLIMYGCVIGAWDFHPTLRAEPEDKGGYCKPWIPDYHAVIFSNPIGLSRNIWTPETHGPPSPNISKYLDPLWNIWTAFTIETGKYIQVVHNGADHWLVVTNTGVSRDGVVRVYDSLYKYLTTSTELQIEYFPSHPSIL